MKAATKKIRHPSWAEGDVVMVQDQTSPLFCWVGKVRFSDIEYTSVDLSINTPMTVGGKLRWLFYLLFGEPSVKVPISATFRNDQLRFLD